MHITACEYVNYSSDSLDIYLHEYQIQCHEKLNMNKNYFWKMSLS